MADVWYVFQACGAASWLVMLVAIIAIPLSMLAVALTIGRVRAAKVVAGLAFIVALLPVGIGAVGMSLGRAKVDAILESGVVDPTLRERLRIEGYKEADGCGLVGIGFGAFPLVISLAAIALAFVLVPKRA
ncbi:MAG TPA: hypothetical protein VMS65_16910 [Polyangiaceae bacterium]|nr:hypothetical protein [Polyangiaceae bacterium]